MWNKLDQFPMKFSQFHYITFVDYYFCELYSKPVLIINNF